ncbi:MAG: hypothetical protein M3347_06460 [Armatimonadota bacterium]|nr:hypothetical protein [Armatimonadota bacterium]
MIFATNLAANFDPAFERRVRTHILFEMPGPEERAQIWKVQLHARKTPLADDVDFKALGEKYAVSGGDIKNAVLKAAQLATMEPGADVEKKIHHRHFELGMQDVLAAKKVMEQSLFAEGDGSHPLAALTGINGAWSQISQSQEALENQVTELRKRHGEVERRAAALPGIVERFDDAARAAQLQMRAELTARLDEVAQKSDETAATLTALKDEVGQVADKLQTFDEHHAALKEQIGTAIAQITTHREDAQVVQQNAEALWRARWMMGLSVGLVSLALAVGALVTALLH